VRHRRHFSAIDSAFLLAAIGECRRACIVASSKAPIGGPIYRAATRLIEEIDLMAEALHRRSTTFLAQAVEHSWLEAADRSKTRHLRLGLGADEGRAGTGTEQTRRARGMASARGPRGAQSRNCGLFEGRHQLHSNAQRRDDPGPIGEYRLWRSLGRC